MGALIPISELRARRKARGWTLDELSDRSGVSPAGICLIEKGRRPNPHIETLIRLSNALNQHPIKPSRPRKAKAA